MLAEKWKCLVSRCLLSTLVHWLMVRWRGETSCWLALWVTPTGGSSASPELCLANTNTHAHTVMLHWDELKSVFCCKPVLFIQMFSHSPCKAWRHQTPADCLVCRVSTGHWVNIKNICAQSPSVIVYRKFFCVIMILQCWRFLTKGQHESPPFNCCFSLYFKSWLVSCERGSKLTVLFAH